MLPRSSPSSVGPLRASSRSRSSSPEERPRRSEPGLRIWLLVASVALHLGAIATAWLLPASPVPRRADPWAELGPVVVVERLDDAARPDEVPVAESSEPSVATPRGETPERGTRPPGADHERGPTRPQSGRPRDEPAGPEPSDGPSTPGPAGATDAAVSLLGLRTRSRVAASGSLRPELDWTHAPAQRRDPPGTDDTPSGFEHAPARRIDGEPRSLAEAGFERRRNGDLVYVHPKRAFKAEILPDGRVRFRDLVAVPSNAPGMSEIVRAAQGKELYQQQKKRILRETFELRLSLAVSYAQRQIDRELRRLQRDLLDLWNDDSRSARERRRLLFARWDECEESLAVDLGEFQDAAATRLAELRKGAGEQARGKIEAFIRRHLPRGEPGAFTEQELLDLNRGRHSRQRFEPYE